VSAIEKVPALMPSETKKIMFFAVLFGSASLNIEVEDAQELANPKPSEPSAVFLSKSLLFILTNFAAKLRLFLR